ncbi:hypothetical protein RchiOBHm_Chr4g0412081 [Rosa chinensis]|uniref:Uncharacterized protein n=1 Tax=Rosa chinensis TaxID=74649 RepID=A0A2P6QVR4_ROSCH|nr:hypothetical protein RchiOBHm_Chr4g0412081 [Rosa chinensis]
MIISLLSKLHLQIQISHLCPQPFFPVESNPPTQSPSSSPPPTAASSPSPSRFPSPLHLSSPPQLHFYSTAGTGSSTPLRLRTRPPELAT